MEINSLGTTGFSQKQTDVSALINLAKESVKSKLNPGVAINSVLGAPECVIEADSSLLGQVLMNLLVNACKFTTKGAITFGFEEYENEIYFFVRDSGAGLTPEMRDRITDLFEKGDTMSPGLGLGLPISATIIQKLGGSIGVESRGEGRGCTFWFTIPLIRANKEEESTAVDTPVSGNSSQSAAADTPAKNVILVAEDNNSNYLLFQTMLKKKYEVVRAVDGLEAVELFKKVNPNIILMDIQMPNMDGYEAAREIRKISADVPIIAVTAYAFVTDRQRLLENGFNGYVSKPINMARLEQEIEKCLAK